MTWIDWIIVAFFILGIVAKLGSSGSTKSTRNNRQEKDVSVEAKEMAENVTTIQQFRSLVRKLDKAENRIVGVESERAYDYENACHRHDVLQDAVDIAQSKIYQWQFLPSVDLHTPKQILDHAYKVYSDGEYREIKDSISNDESDWYGIDGSEDKEDLEPYIKSLKKFRAIVESGEPKEVIIKKINQLVSRDKSLSEEFFDPDDSLTPGDWWFSEDNRLPLAYDLCSEVYTTPKKCLAHIEIEYEDVNQSVTIRSVRIKEFDNVLFGGSIIGHCELRNASRTFRFDRIKKCINLETGELITNVKKFINNLHEESPERSKEILATNYIDVLKVIYFMIKADGQYMKEEKKVIYNYVKKLVKDDRITPRMIDEILNEVDVPTIQGFKLAFDRVLKGGEVEPVLLASCCQEIVDSQKSAHPMGKEVLEYIGKKLSSLPVTNE